MHFSLSVIRFDEFKDRKENAIKNDSQNDNEIGRKRICFNTSINLIQSK